VADDQTPISTVETDRSQEAWDGVTCVMFASEALPCLDGRTLEAALGAGLLSRRLQIRILSGRN